MIMQASRSLLWYATIFLTSLPYAASDTIEPLSFVIITSDQYVAPVDASSSSSSLRMTLTWDSSSYECVTQLSSTSHTHQCDIQASASTPVAPFAIATNPERRLQIESGDDIEITEIIVLGANHNNYTVTTFCTGNEGDDECPSVVTVRSADIHLLSQKAIVHRNNQTHELIQPATAASRRQLVEVGAGNHDIAYFTLQISSTEGSGILDTTSFYFQADVYWGVYWFQCTYGIPFPDGALLECHPNRSSTYQTTPTFTDGRNSIYPLEDSYRFHFSHAYSNDSDFVRIASITVHTNNGNFYVIDEFCSPRQFNTSNTPLSDTFCVEYPHKYRSDELEVSFVYNSVVDVEFLDAIRFAESQAERSSYANQPYAGNAKAPVIEQFTIKFNQSAVADVTLPEYTLYFDEYIYACLGEDSSANSTPPNRVICNAVKTGYSRTECDHDSQFRLHIFNNGDSTFNSHSPLIIDEIDITTGSQLQIHHMDRFCIADADTRIQAAGTETGATCASSAFAGGDTLTEWSQVCVGDGLSPGDPDSCSETAIDIFFPDDLFAYADYPVSRAMEGKVVYSSGRLVERTCVPTNEPTSKPTVSPTAAPTQSPTEVPTALPTATPTVAPTDSPTVSPTGAPTFPPTSSPTSAPSFSPTAAPTDLPTDGPTSQPTVDPTVAPSDSPTTATPTVLPTSSPTVEPSAEPTVEPTSKPTLTPTVTPTDEDEDEDEQNATADDGALQVLVIWFNENTANKVLSSVGLAFLIFIVCLLVYICRVKRSWCFKERGEADDDGDGGRMHNLMSASSNAQQPIPVPAAAAATSVPFPKQSVSSFDAGLAEPDPTPHSAIEMGQMRQIARMNTVPVLPISSVYGQPRAQVKRAASHISVPERDEYVVHFREPVLGMTLSTLTTDKFSLYVKEVADNSQASRSHVRQGDRLVALNGESIEGIGTQVIGQRIFAAKQVLPMSVMFRRHQPLHQRGLKNQLRDLPVPSHSVEGLSFEEQVSDDYYHEPGTPIRLASVAPSFAGIPAISMPLQPHQEEKSSEEGSDGDAMYVNNHSATPTPATAGAGMHAPSHRVPQHSTSMATASADGAASAAVQADKNAAQETDEVDLDLEDSDDDDEDSDEMYRNDHRKDTNNDEN